MKVKDYSYETFPRYTVNIDGALELKGNKENLRCQYKRISPGKGKKEGKITGIQKVSDSHYPFHPYFFIHLQRSLPQKASGWRGRDVYIEKTFTSVCHLCSKLRKLWPIGMTNSNKDVLLMCIYIHPCLTLINKGGLRVLYISAWAFCVVRSR